MTITRLTTLFLLHFLFITSFYHPQPSHNCSNPLFLLRESHTNHIKSWQVVCFESMDSGTQSHPFLAVNESVHNYWHTDQTAMIIFQIKAKVKMNPKFMILAEPEQLDTVPPDSSQRFSRTSSRISW
jgi:hypothetical protein